jgi:methylmalonyl-CoA/ethylmalonyl-CoA epimerase
MKAFAGRGIDICGKLLIIRASYYQCNLFTLRINLVGVLMTNKISRRLTMGKNTAGKSTFTRMMHVGVVVRDMDKTIERLNKLGIGPFQERILPPDAVEKFRGKPFIPSQRVKIQITQVGNMELELIQPLAGESPHREFLDQKGEGIQHLGFMVDNLDEAVKGLTAEQSSIMLTSQFKGGGGVAYLDLEAAGLIVELVQRGSTLPETK